MLWTYGCLSNPYTRCYSAPFGTSEIGSRIHGVVWQADWYGITMQQGKAGIENGWNTPILQREQLDRNKNLNWKRRMFLPWLKHVHEFDESFSINFTWLIYTELAHNLIGGWQKWRRKRAKKNQNDTNSWLNKPQQQQHHHSHNHHHGYKVGIIMGIIIHYESPVIILAGIT